MEVLIGAMVLIILGLLVDQIFPATLEYLLDATVDPPMRADEGPSDADQKLMYERYPEAKA